MPERKRAGVYPADVKELAKRLKLRKEHHNHTALLLGARTGALFRSEHFYESLQQFSYLGFNGLSHLKQFAECYSILTKTFSEAEIHSLLRVSLQDMALTRAEHCLAEFVKHEYFDEIISTNVDGFLEQALIQAEMKEGHDFEIIIAGRSPFHDKSFPLRIIKPFGSFSSRDYTISDRRTYLSKHGLEVFLQSILARDILIIGIDPIWDDAIIRLLPGDAGSLWFINEEDLTEHAFIASILHARQTSYISGKEGSFDNFVRALHEQLYGGVPINQQLVRNITRQLSDMTRQLQILQDEHKLILSEIKKIQQEIGNLSQRRDQQ